MRRLQTNWRVVVLYLFLLAAGIPWYWPAGDERVWFGLPAWAAMALLVSIAVSIITAIILLRYRWPGEEEDADR